MGANRAGRGLLGAAAWGLSLIAAMALAACGSAPPLATGAAKPTATPQPTATAIPTTAPDPSTLQGRMAILVINAVGAEAKAVSVTYTPTNGDVTVDITLVWSPDWKARFDRAQAVAKLACFQAQTALWRSGTPFSQVAVVVMGQALDDYSSVITSAYAAAVISSRSAQRVDWSSTTAAQAWQVYDTVFLRPTYAPNWVYLSTSER